MSKFEKFIIYFVRWFKRKLSLVRKFAGIWLLGLRPTAFEGRKQGPKVLLNSLPKSGSNLVLELIHHLPLMRGRITKTLVTELGVANILSEIDKIKMGECIPSHLAYDPEIEQKLVDCDIRLIFVIRDFRDAILSHINYIDRIDVTHRFYDLFGEDKSLDEKLDICLNGVPGRHDTWDKLADSYKNWLTARNVLIIRFEELISFDERTQHRTIDALAKFLNIEIDSATDLASTMINHNGATFFQPSAGKWKQVFCSAQVEKINAVMARALRDYGYDI